MCGFIIYLTECHKARFISHWWCLIAHHMGNRQPSFGAITWQCTTATNNFIHPCTSSFLRWTRIWVKVEICNWTTCRIFHNVESHIIVPNLRSKNDVWSAIETIILGQKDITRGIFLIKKIILKFRYITGERPSAGSMSIPKSILARLKRPSMTFGNEKKGRSSSCLILVQKNKLLNQQFCLYTIRTKLIKNEQFQPNHMLQRTFHLII